MDASWPEAALCDLESSAFTQQHITRRDADIFVMHFCMALRRIVVAEHGERADNLDAWRIEWHEYHRLLLVLFGIRVGFPHDDRDAAARVHGACRPPFLGIDDVFIAIADDAALDIGGVG